MTTEATAPAQAKGLKDLFAITKRQNDLVLAALLVAIVALFVLPLPTPLIDLLITTNLTISFGVLMVSMYVASALNLSTFPSLLLFTTLFRLALNVASTKLILLHADAGHIIDTFGKLIVGNNVVVGGVVFLIIAIVQFIVIAKGSERVAEVAARFALDAMPGKQMSIDADVRAGVLTSTEAQKKRRLLEEESQMHGAMDGAMKFVKGDAIAGIVIALVNILAGVAIGTLMHNMPVGQALQRYAILTIGDAMVSQIPSLLVSIAAGLVITRVGSAAVEGRSTHLATSIARQVLAYPRALIVTGFVLATFLLVPGFPKWSFGLLALGVTGAGVFLMSKSRLHRTPGWISHADGEDDEPMASGNAAVATALAVQLSPSLQGKIDRQRFDNAMAEAKAAVELDLGPIFPNLQFTYSKLAPENGYQILVQDVVMSRGTLRPGAFMLDPSQAGTGAAAPKGAQTAEAFGPFPSVAWVSAEIPGGKTFSCEEVMVKHIENVARNYVWRLIGIQEVQRLIHWVQRDSPDLAAEISRVVPLPRITEVLRRLLMEGVPIRNLRFIFESLVSWAANEQDNMMLTELVRIDMGRYITSRYVGTDRKLDAILFESNLLEKLQSSLERTATGFSLTLSPASTHEIREQLRQIINSRPATDAQGAEARSCVIVVPVNMRRSVKKVLVESIAPKLPVLSYQELDEDVALNPVGWVKAPQAT